jgi:hypothetical protein
VQPFKARDEDCNACQLRHRCLKNPATRKGRSVSLFGRALVDERDPSEKMRKAIDSAPGRALYSRRMVTVEPVFANIRRQKALEPLHTARQEQGRDTVSAVLPGAQHPEDRNPGDAR